MVEIEILDNSSFTYHGTVKLKIPMLKSSLTTTLLIKDSPIGCGHSFVKNTRELFSYRQYISKESIEELKNILKNIHEKTAEIANYSTIKSGLLIASCKKTKNEEECEFLESLGFKLLDSYINPFESKSHESIQEQCLYGLRVNTSLTEEKYGIKQAVQA